MSNIKSFILHSGEVKALAGAENEDQMLISGWASTKDLDLANDIVLPTAFQKRWDSYAKKGRYWFNHNPNMVIGVVKDSRLTGDGFYIDKAKLSPTTFVKDFIWPNVKEGALNEHSIQFQSFDPEVSNGILYHKDVMVLETSIVSLACNPGAVITGFKGLVPSEEYHNATLEQLAQLAASGQLKYPSEVRKSFYVDGLRAIEEEPMPRTELPTVDLSDMRVIARDKSNYDPEGNVVADFKLPSQRSKKHEDVCNVLYLVKSDIRRKHMFRVATVTEKGWCYDWSNVAVSLGTVFGAKGITHFIESEKIAVAKELFGIYKELGKTLPTFDGEQLDELSDDALLSVKFHDLTFNEKEDELLQAELVKSNLKALQDSAAFYAKNGGVPEDLATYVKGVYPEFSAYFSIYPGDDESRAFLHGLMALYENYLAAKEKDRESYAYSLDTVDSVEKAKIIAARMLLAEVDAKYLEAKANGEEAPAVETPAEEEGSDMQTDEIDDVESLFE